MHAVFGLVEDDGLRSIEDGVGDFGVAMRGETVHEDGVRLGVGHQGFIDLIGLEYGRALGGLVLEAHAGADVGVYRVGIGDGFDRVVQKRDAASCISAISIALWMISSLGAKPFGDAMLQWAPSWAAVNISEWQTLLPSPTYAK